MSKVLVKKYNSGNYALTYKDVYANLYFNDELKQWLVTPEDDDDPIMYYRKRDAVSGFKYYIENRYRYPGLGWCLK